MAPHTRVTRGISKDEANGRWSLSFAGGLFFGLLLLASFPPTSSAQVIQSEPPQSPPPKELNTTADWNLRLRELVQATEGDSAANPLVLREYRIGPEDLIEISVFEAPELNRTVRVTASGEISLPLLGSVQASGLSSQELELVLQELLRRTYMKDPHVGVFVREMESHSVSVFGAVERPGVFQIRGTKTLLEVLSMAQGLAEDAGDTVVVMRGATAFSPESQLASNSLGADTPTFSLPTETEAGSPAASPTQGQRVQEAIEINLKMLLESGNPKFNIPIYPGDVVKVTRAGIVYVVGEVKKPGGFVLRTNENISVLQAIALAEGLTRTSANSKARIIRTDESTGERREIAFDLGKILSGKQSDLLLQPKDIVFVPNSTSRTALFRATEAAISIVGGLIVFR